MPPQNTPQTGTPHPQSADYSALAEMSYRRNPDANSQHIDVVEGVSSMNLLDAPSLKAAANEWQQGTDVATFLREQYGLTVDPTDRGDGLTHIHSESGFSGFVTVRDNGTADPSDDQFIITYRGTDMADNADGDMLGHLQNAAKPLAGAAGLGIGSIDAARNAHPSFDDFKTELTPPGGSYLDFSTDYDDKDNFERLVDAGDIYTNGLLGQGTYQATQYDDATALFDVVNDHLATDGQAVVTNGQSLGGGLAALVGVEKNVETHTFGMAPFQRQFEIIGQRNAVENMLTDPATAGKFGDLGATYQAASPMERHTMERELSEGLSRLRTDEGGHDGVNSSQRIRAFNYKHGTNIDRDTIREFRSQAEANEMRFEVQKTNINGSTVAGEFTTNSGDGSVLGGAVAFGSKQIIPTDQLHTYDIGPDQSGIRRDEIRRIEANGGAKLPWTGLGQKWGTIIMGEGLSSHSPALHDLITASQANSSARTDSDAGLAAGGQAPAGSFDALLRGNPAFRYTMLHQNGALGGLNSGKVGMASDPSASQSEAASNETVYRALANSLRGDGVFYTETHNMLTTLGTVGRAAEGIGESPIAPTINAAVTRFAAQDLRNRVQGLAPGEDPGAAVGTAGNAGNGSGLLTFDLKTLEPENNLNRAKGPGGVPRPGMEGVHGYTDLQTVFYNEVRDKIPTPSDSGLLDNASKDRTRIAEDLTGANQDYRLFGQVESNLTFPGNAMDMRWLYVQSGSQTGRDWNLQERLAAMPGEEGNFGVFMDSGDNTIWGSDTKDYISLGAGNDGYSSRVRGGALVSGGEGIDTYAVQPGTGPVFASVSESHVRVGRIADLGVSGRAARDSLDTSVGVERFSLGEADDRVVVDGVKDGTFIDGGAGRNYIDYRALDASFRLDTTDGVTARGEAYSARLTDGTRSLYFINIEDEDISRTAPDAQRAGKIEQDNTEQDATRFDLRTAVNQLRADLKTLDHTPADGTSADKLAREIAATPMPLAAASAVHSAGGTHISVADTSTPQRRILSIIRGCFGELENLGVSIDAVKQEYTAIDAAGARADNVTPTPSRAYNLEVDSAGVV